jgi:cyclic pyranopterin phosphate synthase
MPDDLPKGFFANVPKMTAEEINSIASVLVKLGIKKIRLTGGEPLLRKDFKEIIHRLSFLPAELAITTNGVFIDEYIDEMKNARIKSVNVSLDTLNKEKFSSITKRDSFNRVHDNIHLLLMNYFHVKVNVVLMRNVNDDEILHFIAWAKNLPIHIRFIEFMPFNGNQWEKGKIVSQKEVLEKIKACYEVIKLKDKFEDTTKKYCISGYAGTFAFISTISKPFCEGCNRIRLTSDGKLRNCLFAKHETDLLTPLRKGEDLVSMIESSVYKKEAMQGGRTDLDTVNIEREYTSTRCMVSIGG